MNSTPPSTNQGPLPARSESKHDRSIDRSAQVECIKQALRKAERLLPNQAPITSFAYYNTLHAFECMPFEEALEQAGQILGAEPYPSESAFRKYQTAQLLTACDIEEILEKEPTISTNKSELGGVSLRDFVKSRLVHLFEPVSDDNVRFRLAEEALFDQFHPLVSETRRQQLSQTYPNGTAQLLAQLWHRLSEAAPTIKSLIPVDRRRRDQLLRVTGIDTDQWVKHVMIRLAGAYLDQGIGYWSMPNRDQSFYNCFLDLLGQPAANFDRWLLGMRQELHRQKREQWSGMDACIAALQTMRVPPSLWEEAIVQSLLSLRGWAGMFRQFEIHPEKVPFFSVPATLLDYLAVFLTLEAQAYRYLQTEHFAGSDLPELCNDSVSPSSAPEQSSLSLIYESFVTAQVTDLDLSVILEGSSGNIWIEWNANLNSIQRRKLLLRAFEHHHLQSLVQSLSNHVDFVKQRSTPNPQFQAIFCIDDREESYRRHLEEVCPGAESYSFPGFFGVAMRYHAQGEVRHRDLCPVVQKPTHIVRELSTKTQRAKLAVDYHMHIGSGTLLRGFLLTVMGLASALPLVLSVLFPRWFRYSRTTTPAQPNKLSFTADGANVCSHEHTQDELKLGYTPEEMAKVVEDLLRSIGLVSEFARLILVVGHGSSSINNPHLAAYGCAATSGGCGGPNARVFAEMANRSDVRDLLGGRGIHIPRVTQFVGCMHDTCTDDIGFYPTQDLSQSSLDELQHARKYFEQASVNNAHERCRLFGQIPLSTSPQKAKRLVERRSVDLSEARPEYDHAKNSCCVLGQRRWTRGLFMDQRAFLVSYDPSLDADGEILKRCIYGSVPIGLGINLQFFLSSVDNGTYGAGSKLPHNVTGLFGVMDGHTSDLRTGLYSQVVELHEPLRLVTVVQAPLKRIEDLLESDPRVMMLVRNGWIRLVAFVPEDNRFFIHEQGRFEPLTIGTAPTLSFSRSVDVYQGKRESLTCVHVEASFLEKSA